MVAQRAGSNKHIFPRTLDSAQNWFTIKLMGASKNPRLRVLDVPPTMPPGGSYAVAAWVALMRVFARMERRVTQLLAEHGLGHPQFEVLLNLAMGEGITQQELAERLLVTKGNVCVVLDKMEDKRWVERREDPVD